MSKTKTLWHSLPRHFLILAPMEGVTDVVFRQVIAKAGRPDLFFTEFTNVSSFASDQGRTNALERLDTTPSDHPIIAQIWGKNPEHFAQLATALPELNFQGLDINMGCPDRHVNKAGGGAAMIKSPELALECLHQARTHTSLPVSVKTRLGFSSITEYQAWLTLLLRQDLPALTVHLRTRKEMSKVSAHFELIPELVALRDRVAPATRLIINGDIKDRTHTQELARKHPGVDGFMIGRGVFTNPFCFTSQTPTQAQLLNLLHLHLDLFDQRQATLASHGSRYPFEPLKRFFKIYLHSFPGAAELRAKLMLAKDTTTVRQIIQDFETT
ncbi:MAG: tRNA-dihydrouridine synthase [Candidatus Saccharibacteria bacterium]|nr:tRNA-dihydrouridine synthase [Candidatus Saccharibacteria bacterium]